MQTIDEKPLETIHLYVIRENEKKPQTAIPVIFCMLYLIGIVAVAAYSGTHPYYEHKTIQVPAIFLPVNAFTTQQVIIPTGIKTYPATQAHGILTIYNGSILSQELPKGMILTAQSGVEVVTDERVFVPAGNPPYYGIASVLAHAIVSGKQGNIKAFAIDNINGTFLYIRNLHAFTGGQDAYSVKIVTAQDVQTATAFARASLTAQIAQIKAFLAFPCIESSQEQNSRVTLSWSCQFVTYSVPSYMHVTGVRLSGKNLLVDVVFVPRPRSIQFK